MLSRFISFLTNYIPSLGAGERQPLLTDGKPENKTVANPLGAFQSLPNEAIQHIASYLTDFKSLHVFASTNKKLSEIIKPVSTNFKINDALCITGTYGDLQGRLNVIIPAYRANKKIRRIENSISYKIGNKLTGTSTNEIKSSFAAASISIVGGLAAGITAATAFEAEPIEAFSIGVLTSMGFLMGTFSCVGFFKIKNNCQNYAINNEGIKLKSISVQR